MVPVKENRLLSYIRDIIQGLDYLHHVAGIAHMDLKPENLLKSGDGTVKIADFGVSFIGKANTKNSNKRIVGTRLSSPLKCWVKMAMIHLPRIFGLSEFAFFIWRQRDCPSQDEQFSRSSPWQSGTACNFLKSQIYQQS